MTTDNSDKNLKDAAMDFLQLASSGNVRHAYELYVADNFKHHNPYFKGDRESLMKGMEEADTTSPNKEFTCLHAVAEGNLVAVHSRVEKEKPQLTIAVVHLFRFEGNKVAELWDIVMPQPKEMVNKNGLF